MAEDPESSHTRFRSRARGASEQEEDAYDHGVEPDSVSARPGSQEDGVYFYLNLTEESRPVPHVSLETYAREFAFMHHLCHDDRQTEKTISLCAANQTVIADFLASAVTHLHCTGRLSDSMVLHALRFSRDRLLALGLGYKETNRTHFREILGDRETIMVVLGCQSMRQLRRRVNLAKKLCTHVPLPLAIYFSGARPDGRSLFRIPNEAARMENIFLEDLSISEDLLSRISWKPLFQEGGSTTTKQNLQNVFALTRPTRRREPVNLVVVSSNYHLPDIAVLLAELLPPGPDPAFHTMLLAGSERMDRLTSTTRDHGYVKQCLFRLFSWLIEYHLENLA